MRKVFFAVMLFVVLMIAVPAHASWVPFFSVTLSREAENQMAVSAPQAAMKWGPFMIGQWSEASGEYLKSLPVGENLGDDGIELIIYPNINAGGNQVLGVYYAMAELSGNVGFDRACKPDPNCGLRCARQDEDTKRWYVSLYLNRYRGPQCVWLYALVRDAKTNRYRLLIFSWNNKHNGSQTVGKVEWTNAMWSKPTPDPVTLAKFMVQNGVGFHSYWPDAYNDNSGPLPSGNPASATPPMPSAPPAPTAYVDPDAAERAHEELATGVKVNAENVCRLADGHDAQQAQLNSQDSRITRVERFMDSMATRPATQPQVTYQSQAKQVVILLRNPYKVAIERRFWFVKEDCWQPNSKFVLRLGPGQCVRWEVPMKDISGCVAWDCFPLNYDPRRPDPRNPKVKLRVTEARFSWSEETVEVQ